MRTTSMVRIVVLGLLFAEVAVGQFTNEQLDRWLKQFPDSDVNGDGRLSADEAVAYREKLQVQRRKQGKSPNIQTGSPKEFAVDPGWQAERFPDHAVCYLIPEKITAIYEAVPGHNGPPVTSYTIPTDGSFRIVGTGHSFMAPGYKTFPLIARAAGLDQPPLLTHIGGGITGSARYKWEQENGIFEFDGKPTPKLLASIANAEWEVMMWGPYYHDHPKYYACWIDFCLKYNPHMRFYLADVWPQLNQLEAIPTSEEVLTADLITCLGREKEAITADIVKTLNENYPGKVFVLPVGRAMVLAAQYYHRGELPGVEGIHKLVGGKDRSLWMDKIGHLGPGFGDLEGYVFYATIYGRSPELIEGDVKFNKTTDYPSRELDRIFRKIAWEAVVSNPLSGVVDQDKDGVDDKHNNPKDG